MHQEKITAIFDQQAATYDQKWSRLAPINAALHLLTHSILSTLPADARILCVGCGTGTEILYLAQLHPTWHFTAVEPSTAMLDIFRQRAQDAGMATRCTFHPGFVDTLPPEPAHHAATAFLVSQFILDDGARSQFFRDIATRLHSGGTLVSADLAADFNTPEDQSLLETWARTMSGHGITAEEVQNIRAAYGRDVAVRPPAEVQKIITRGGFEPPVPFYQAGLIHAWYARRPLSSADAS